MVTKHRPTKTTDDLIVVLQYIDTSFKSKDRYFVQKTPPILIYIGADVNRQHPARYINITAKWDDKAKVWAATSDDTLGISTSASSNKSLEADLRVCVPELAELNGLIPEQRETYRLPDPDEDPGISRLYPEPNKMFRSSCSSGFKAR